MYSKIDFVLLYEKITLNDLVYNVLFMMLTTKFKNTSIEESQHQPNFQNISFEKHSHIKFTRLKTRQSQLPDLVLSFNQLDPGLTTGKGFFLNFYLDLLYNLSAVIKYVGVQLPMNTEFIIRTNLMGEEKLPRF